MSSKGFLNIEGLTVTYSRWGQSVHALVDLSLSVPTGQWVILVGHNGSGKSSLLKSIMGQTSITNGKVSIGNDDISCFKLNQLANMFYFVHQNPLAGTAPKLTLFENLLVADREVKNKTVGKKALISKYSELLEPVGLQGRLNQLVQNLSGGERQIASLLIALLRPAKILLLDEPLAALDPARAKICIDLIKHLHREGRTILQISHDLSFAKAEGERVVALSDGSIVFDSPTKSIRTSSELDNELYDAVIGVKK